MPVLQGTRGVFVESGYLGGDLCDSVAEGDDEFSEGSGRGHDGSAVQFSSVCGCHIEGGVASDRL